MACPLVRALPEDAPLLSAIARVAKQSVGYPDAWMACWVEALTVPRAALAAGLGWKAVDARGVCCGFVCLAEGGVTGEWVVDFLFVLPGVQRQGLGRKRLARARDEALQRGAHRLVLDADPTAEAFYLSQGAKREGATPAPMPGQPARHLPRLAWPFKTQAQGKLA